LSVALDTLSEDYDRSKGEQIALNVDGVNATLSEKDFPNGLMDKQILLSSRAIKDPSRYAIGLISQGKLHLTPLKDILVIRPDLSYLDKSDKTAKSREQDFEEAMEGEEEPKQVTVKFAKTDSETLKKNREKTYDYQKKKEFMEKWIPMTYNSGDSEEAKTEFSKLICDNEEGKVNQDVEGGKYLDNFKEQT
ncbi:DNA-directed RNA polymerase III subunit RPC5, partial [Caligus rogercresseyi]